jgi:uncharacterized protein YfaS (alpha-2-macroglobulin family)
MAIGAASLGIVVFAYNHIEEVKALGFGKKSNQTIQRINPEFAQYIAGFTSGYIASGSTIKIRLASQLLESVPLNIPLEENYFEFSDGIKGETTWLDAQTLQFKPSSRLPQGKAYTAKFFLHKLAEVKSELKTFEFAFKVVEQNIKVEYNDLQTYNVEMPNYYKTSGVFYTADFSDPSKIESLLKANCDNKQLNIHWQHDAKNTTHKYYIDSIPRGLLLDSKLNILWDATAIGINEKGEKQFNVPSRGTFTLLNVQVVSNEEQYVLISFSNIINTNQSLEGLIKINEFKDIKFSIDNNQVRVYPNETKTGKYKLIITDAIKDFSGKALDKASEHQLLFDEIKPIIRFVGQGVVLPSSNALSMYFETVNLKAVDVNISRIYEKNTLQFLQENNLDGGYELQRVGKKILQKTINLGITNPADFKHFKKFSLDISSLIKPEKGAIYRVTLSFKRNYSTFSCGGVANTDNNEIEEVKDIEQDARNNYYYDNEDYYDDEDYDWRQENNPCNSSYYRYYKTNVSRNLLASDIGLTVKEGNNGELFMAVANLVTTQPIANTTIELYDYQQQLIQSSKTDGDGLLFITPKERPYFVVAKNKDERAYVKLEDGASLNLTMFDTEGQTIEKGIKGFIYGERGVWRPGDTLFMSFIMEDKLKTLPVNHPIVFELYNPQGQLYKRILKAKGLDGFYTFPINTENTIPTGNWTATCKVGAVEFSKSIRIETVMPNRLKININIGDNKLVYAGDVEKIKLHANWLTGIKAKNLQATVGVSLKPIKTEFAKYKQFTFDDQTIRFESDNINLFDGKLNEDGDASFPCKITTKGNTAGMLKASFATRVYETGGVFSVDRFSLNYSPFKNYVGIQVPQTDKTSNILFTNKTHAIKIATVNYKGNPVSCKQLRVQVYKLSWRWWWNQYEEELANYTSSQYNKPVLTEDISTSNGSGEFNIKIKDEDWGRYLIRVSDIDGGHASSIVTYFDWANWMERGGSDNKIIASLLHFKSNKESYATGEEAQINIPSPKGGRALITIETGSKVLQAHWLETTAGNTNFKFKITPEMAPNIFVHVSLIQAHAQSVNDLPIRLYGVVPINIDDPQTHLRPIISMANTLAPETITNITVSEESNKEMTYTIAMVDEGLLDLTRFKTPDPWASFYAHEALGVKSWDIYDYVIGAYGGELERILSIGGDATELNKDAAKANRFKPMVKFIGPFHLNKGEKQTHKIAMPMYIGSVRTMLIAGYNGAYGFAEKTTPVKSDVMLLGTLPRVLSINEQVKLPVSVFGGDKDLKNVVIKVETNDLVQMVGKSNQVVDVKKNDEKMTTFELKVKQQIGIAKITITATVGDKKSVYAMELDVRNPNPYRSNVSDYMIDAGKELQQNYTSMGIAGTNSGAIEISSIPSINLESRLKYLIEYPNGCVEQTTSAAFAQVYLDQIIALTPQQKNDVETNIKTAISKLQQFQLTSGALAYWPGSNTSSEWGTIYASHFLFAAEKQGYALPVALKQGLLKYLQEGANNWERGNGKVSYADLLQAYRLYVLATAGKANYSAMNRLREEANLSNQAKWRLAACFAITGNFEESEKLIFKLPTTIQNYANNNYTFGSSSRDEAMILETLCMLNKQTIAVAAFKKLASTLSNNAYMSTQSTAYGLIASAAFISKYGNSSALQATMQLNGQEIKFKGNNALNSVKIDFGKNPTGTFRIQNKGKGPIYVRLINRGKPAVGDEKEEEMNIVADVKYKNEKGETIEPSALKQGSNFTMEVLVKNTGTLGALQNLALQNYIPSGWEIHNQRMDNDEATQTNFTYQDIRDDRIFTYFDLKENETKRFVFSLNATYNGSYFLPGINVEAMYDNSIYARKKGTWIKVVNAD